MESKNQVQTEGPAPASSHRRPPLAEVDTWELWQAWHRGERSVVLPWIGLLASFCLVLAGMYSFFFFSTSLTDDTGAMLVLSIVFLAILFWLWRRISPRRGFALAVVMLILLVSTVAFVVWLLVYGLSGWNAWAAIAGTVVLGLAGAFTGLPALNAIARQQESAGELLNPKSE